MKEWHLQIEGRVQGVGFRQFTASQARRLGLKGWVRNRPDGSVECRVQGESAALEKFFQTVNKGPALSRVDTVRKREVSPDQYPGFDITH